MDTLTHQARAFERQVIQARKRFHKACDTQRDQLSERGKARADRRERIARRNMVNAERYAFDLD